MYTVQPNLEKKSDMFIDLINHAQWKSHIQCRKGSDIIK